MGRRHPAFCFPCPIWMTAAPTKLYPYTGGVQTQLTIQTIRRALSLTSPGSHCHLPTGSHRPPLYPLATVGCSHQILNSGPGVQRSSGSHTCMSAGSCVSIPSSLRFVLPFSRPLTVAPHFPPGSSASSPLTSLWLLIFLLLPRSKMSFLLQVGQENDSMPLMVRNAFFTTSLLTLAGVLSLHLHLL